MATGLDDMQQKISRMLADYYRVCQTLERLQADCAVHPQVRAIYLSRAACYDELIEHAEACARDPRRDLDLH